MPQIQINLRETIEVPEGSQIVLNASGNASSIRLPSGELLKPWIQLEHYEDADGDGKNIGTCELEALGVFVDIEFDRDIQPSFGNASLVEIDESAVA